jgi:hypothetical protein
MASSAVASIDPAQPGRQAAARCPSSARPRGRGHREHLFGFADTHDRLVGADLVLPQRPAQPRSRSPSPVGRSATSVGVDGMTPDIASPPSSVSERRGSTRSGQILARLRYPVWHGSSLSGGRCWYSDMEPRRRIRPVARLRRGTGRPGRRLGRVRRPYSGAGDRPLRCRSQPAAGLRLRSSTRQPRCDLGHSAQKPLRTSVAIRQYRGESATWAAGHRPDTAPGLTAPTPPDQHHRSVAATTPPAPRARTPQRR